MSEKCFTKKSSDASRKKSQVNAPWIHGVFTMNSRPPAGVEFTGSGNEGTTSFFHTNGWRFFVPEGRLIIAQQFTAGEMGNHGDSRPGGTPEGGIPRHGFNRPSGTKKRRMGG